MLLAGVSLQLLVCRDGPANLDHFADFRRCGVNEVHIAHRAVSLNSVETGSVPV